MSSGGKIFLFILLFPFLAALGHDVYYNYFSDDEKIRKIERLQIDPKEFQMSDLGWIWQNYSPTTMQTTRDSVMESVWKEKIDPVLQFPSMMVAIIPFVVGIIFCLLAKILGVWPFTETLGRFSDVRKKNDSVYKHAKSKAIKYSRK